MKPGSGAGLSAAAGVLRPVSSYAELDYAELHGAPLW
jgi:hypothetical protein